MTTPPDIVEWAESAAGFYLADTKRPIKLAPHQKAILRHCFTPNENGRFPYDTILYSCPKKSGKTTLSALVGLYFALFIPGEIFCLANDMEQSQGRVFSDVKEACKLNPHLTRRTKRRAKTITMDNGTEITALASDYAGAAGSRHALTLWDELWGYVSENSRRLWDELTPVPTLPNSVRFVSTYAGFESESELLKSLYDKGQAGQPIPELTHIENGKGVPACTSNGRLFCYWDFELKQHAGLNISPAEYHEQQRQDLRPSAFARLHLNEWQSSVSAFVDAEQWDSCYSPAVIPLQPGDSRKVYFAADASVSRDFTSLVGCVRNGAGGQDVVYVKVWQPKRGKLRGGKPTIDLAATIGAELLRLWENGNVAAVAYDPYQLHHLMSELQKKGLPVKEFQQGKDRIQADTALLDAILNRSLRHYNQPQLNEAIANAVAKENTRSSGLRLDKSGTTKKIDAAVCLSMARATVPKHGKPQPLPKQPHTKSRWRVGQASPFAGSRWEYEKVGDSLAKPGEIKRVSFWN